MFGQIQTSQAGGQRYIDTSPYGEYSLEKVSHQFWPNSYFCLKIKMEISMGRSPGLVVMGGDLCSKGHGFESRHHILDGLNIFHVYLL